MIRRRKMLFLCAGIFTVFFVYCRLNKTAETRDHFGDVDELLPAARRKQRFALSHPFENSCRYPILQPEDENLRPYIEHGYRVQCDSVQADLVKWNEETGVLSFDRQLAERTFNGTVACRYQTFAGGVVPDRLTILPLTPWTLLKNEVAINEDMVQVECEEETSSELAYRFAFSQVAARKTEYAPNTRNKLSLDILVLDSTSLNMFRRHAPLSWDYMEKKMGFFVFEGFTKVGDNSLVNLLPLLTGLRYKDMAPGMPSDVPMDRPLDSEETPFLWHLFRAKKCATMFNDDIAHELRGFMNYPLDETPGFKSKPADHFYRAWHLYHRSQPISNSSEYCFGNEPYYKQQIALTRQMIKRYENTCHFSFNFLTDLTHDDPNHLEALDEELLGSLEQLFEGGYLDNTVLVIMGDHGNRIELIRYTYVGRIEERMPLFAVYLPESFRKAHPEIERNLRINRHRLTTHFDAHEMFRNILEENFSGRKPKAGLSRPIRGVSLFEPIPARRTCKQAHVPLNFCVCMVKNRTLSGNDTLLFSWAEDLLSQWIIDNFSQRILNCQLRPVPVVITQLYALTTNQYVQQGVRNMSDSEEVASTIGMGWLDGDIEYLEAKVVVDSLGTRGIAQFQHNKVLKTLVLNLDPYMDVNARDVLKTC